MIHDLTHITHTWHKCTYRICDTYYNIWSNKTNDSMLFSLYFRTWNATGCRGCWNSIDLRSLCNFIDWQPPNNINIPNIDHYIIQSSNKSEIPAVKETSTLATFLSPCEDLNNLFINTTAVDRCEHANASIANFRPSRLVTVVTNSPITSNSGPGEFYESNN